MNKIIKSFFSVGGSTNLHILFCVCVYVVYWIKAAFCLSQSFFRTNFEKTSLSVNFVIFTHFFCQSSTICERICRMSGECCCCFSVLFLSLQREKRGKIDAEHNHKSRNEPKSSSRQQQRRSANKLLLSIVFCYLLKTKIGY